MELKVGKYTVGLKDSLTWGDTQEIQKVMASGAKLTQTGMSSYDASAIFEAKYKLLELAIAEIKDGDQVISFTRDWMNALSVEDGDALYAAADQLNKKKSS